jgi:hypothetical protein
MSYWTKALVNQIEPAKEVPDPVQAREPGSVQGQENPKTLQLQKRTGPQTSPTDGGASQGKRSESSQSQKAQALVDQLGVDNPDFAAKVGATFLEKALTASKNDQDAAASLVRLALASLRRGAASPSIRRALQNNMEHREYAALLGNLALAEDIGIKYGLGTKDAATKAIFAANALGGSPTAYELAANYALATEPVSAAALYARAFSQLSPSDPGEREHINADFHVALSSARVLASVPDISDFDPSKLKASPTSNADAHGYWYEMVTDQPHVFEFNGSRVSRGITPQKRAAMSFFIVHDPSLGDRGADRRCTQLAEFVGAGVKKWRAHLTGDKENPQGQVQLQISTGPLLNAKGEVVARSLHDLYNSRNDLRDKALTERGTKISRADWGPGLIGYLNTNDIGGNGAVGDKDSYYYCLAQ